MKTNWIKTLAIIVIILYVTSMKAALGLGLFDDKKENRKVENFNEIGLSIPADLYLTQGTKNEVIIEADEDLLEKIETEVRGSSLEIKFEKWYNYRGSGKINIYITVKEIQKLVVSGSGDIFAKSAIKSDEFTFIVSGSGSVLIDELKTNEVDAMITGSGDVRLGGNASARYLDVTVTGSGDFESEDLKFSRADLNITGSGTISSFIVDDLKANITGSGRIYYKGNPLIDANITGSGKIKNDN